MCNQTFVNAISSYDKLIADQYHRLAYCPIYKVPNLNKPMSFNMGYPIHNNIDYCMHLKNNYIMNFSTCSFNPLQHKFIFPPLFFER